MLQCFTFALLQLLKFVENCGVHVLLFLFELSKLKFMNEDCFLASEATKVGHSFYFNIKQFNKWSFFL